MSLDRRRFVTASLGGAAGLVLAPESQGAKAARPPADEPILVVLQLRGGNDGLSTVVPYQDDAYFRARPTIALPKKSLLCSRWPQSLNQSSRHQLGSQLRH